MIGYSSFRWTSQFTSSFCIYHHNEAVEREMLYTETPLGNLSNPSDFPFWYLLPRPYLVNYKIRSKPIRNLAG